ncbi:hypothetical protein [Lactiplantibacillus brownii]|uniref:hypothetical protein n=1 Tax=Lactiplantibacillus brownii TaxID=3069269 RepID=UPI0038B30C9D
MFAKKFRVAIEKSNQEFRNLDNNFTHHSVSFLTLSIASYPGKCCKSDQLMADEVGLYKVVLVAYAWRYVEK